MFGLLIWIKLRFMFNRGASFGALRACRYVMDDARRCS